MFLDEASIQVSAGDVGEELQLERERAPLALGAGLGAAGRAVGGRREVLVAAATAAALRHE